VTDEVERGGEGRASRNGAAARARSRAGLLGFPAIIMRRFWELADQVVVLEEWKVRKMERIGK
jgi:hypothetical protein